MSKNVAVFVDVANIFYAAKAAGIDIDYVTLLKSATAGRDFVRAYAYTGLDPENENQRQFHSFLARNSYKVISKDIRKYGDGRIKANLDIELVVDMMKLARNLDIAVVVSGDGDFASAIRAVQEMGVRVEVISFRGNTSSDLIEVADQFTDIAQIARVDKSSGRSGRRVAAEGDLSMTEVPEKETEGAPRRRRGGGRTRDEREFGEVAALPAAAAAATLPASNLVVLPGERLSRAPEGEDGVDELEIAAVAADPDQDPALGESEEARRRRRRRGGRGRGRGRRGETERYGVASTGDTAAEVESDEEDEFEELVPAQPPHQTFGSVWDSQIGVPTGAAAGSFATYQPSPEGPNGEEEDLDEPEVPEYLLAERRQRGQRPTAGRGGRPMQRGNRAAYQVALDRERFGRGSTPTPSGFGANSGSSGGNTSGGGGRSDRQDRGRDRNRGRERFGQGRSHDRPPRNDSQPFSSPRSAEPWSEVPPELEEMLRAELERKTGSSGARPSRPAPAFEQRTESVSAPVSEAEPEATQFAEETPPKPARRSRTTKAAAETATTAETPTAEAVPGDESTPAKKPTVTRKRATTPTTRSRTTKAKAGEASADESPAADEPAAEAQPKKPATRRRKTTSTEES